MQLWQSGTFSNYPLNEHVHLHVCRCCLSSPMAQQKTCQFNLIENYTYVKYLCVKLITFFVFWWPIAMQFEFSWFLFWKHRKIFHYVLGVYIWHTHLHKGYPPTPFTPTKKSRPSACYELKPGNGPPECKDTCIFWNLIQNWVSQKKIQQHNALEENLREWGGLNIT